MRGKLKESELDPIEKKSLMKAVNLCLLCQSTTEVVNTKTLLCPFHEGLKCPCEGNQIKWTPVAKLFSYLYGKGNLRIKKEDGT